MRALFRCDACHVWGGVCTCPECKHDFCARCWSVHRSMAHMAQRQIQERASR